MRIPNPTSWGEQGKIIWADPTVGRRRETSISEVEGRAGGALRHIEGKKAT